MIIIQQRSNWLLKAKDAKNLRQSNEVASLIVSRMFFAQKSTNFAMLLQVKQSTTELKYSWMMKDVNRKG